MFSRKSTGRPKKSLKSVDLEDQKEVLLGAGINDSIVSRDSIVETFKESKEEELYLRDSLAQTKKSYSARVFAWTRNNARAYSAIKAIQAFITGILLTVSLLLYRSWQTDFPNDVTLPVVQLCIALLIVDLSCFALDYLMLIRRPSFLVYFRVAACLGSLVLSGLIQSKYFNEMILVSSQNSRLNLVLVSIGYCYQSYLVWAIVNAMIYF